MTRQREKWSFSVILGVTKISVNQKNINDEQ